MTIYNTLSRRSACGSTAACMLVFLASSATAAPSIQGVSGSITGNSTVTITGAGFGTKSTATPLVWDTFENGKVGNKILTSSAIIGQWQTGAGYDAWDYSTAIVHSGAKSAHANTSSSVYNASLSQNGVFQTIYMDWWVYAVYKDNPSRNWKPWRVFMPNDQGEVDYVWMCPQDGYVSNIIAEDGSSKIDWNGIPVNNITWYHFQVYLRESSPNVADGIYRQYINGTLTGNLPAVKTRKSGSLHWDQIRIGHYWGTEAGSCAANSGANLYVDDVYVDTSWAHVEIADNAVYTNATHREIQIPSSWSDSSISITINPGSFNAGKVVYLFVIDSNGNTNTTGYPVSIGGSNISSPKNLTITNK